MFLHDNDLESKIQKNKTKIKELSIKFEALDREVSDLLKELNVTPEQLTEFVRNQQNFCEEDWAKLQQEQQKMSAKLQLELHTIRNPKDLKKKYAERVVQNHWLFVR